jgi:Cys-rich repeat protein
MRQEKLNYYKIKNLKILKRRCVMKRKNKNEVSMFLLAFIVLVVAFSCGKKEEKCVTNADCPSGQVCIAGSCETPQQCSKDSDCKSGYVCIDNICFPEEAGKCKSSADCPQNYVCEDGTCVVLKDTTPPETTITSKPSDPSNSSDATFTFTCSEQNCTFECKIDSGQWESCSSPKTYNNLSEGKHSFEVRAIDSAGNVDQSPASYSWTIDTTPPETTITSYPQNPTSSTSATFTFTCNEQNCTFECRIDSGQWESCSSPKTYPGLQDGNHKFEVHAIDSAGNVETPPASYSWTIDTNPPETTIVSAPSDPSNSSDATFTFTCDEQNCTFECRIDEGEWESCSSPKTYINLSDGNHTFEVRAIDSAGNVDRSPASYSWTIDTNPPDTTIGSAPSDPSNSSDATFEFDCDEQNCTFECRIDDGEWESCSSPKTYTGLEDGNHTFEVRAIDSAGNVDQSPASYSWTIDTDPPETTIVSKPSDPSNSSEATFEFDCDEQNCAFECRIDDGEWESCSSPKTYTGLQDGNHTFEVRAIDSAGNVETPPVSYSWTIDTDPPETTIVSKPSDPSNSSDATFEFDCDEQNCTFECRIDDGEWESCSSPKTYTGLEDGNHTFEVRAIDSAGNVETPPVSYSWTIDTNPPDTTIGSAPSDPSNSSEATFTFTCSEQNCTFECRIDDGEWESCSSPKTYTDLSEGGHSFEVRAIDSAGNVDGTPASYSWAIIGNICSSNGDAIRIFNPEPVDGGVISEGENTFRFTIEYNIKSQDSTDLYINIYDENWNTIYSETKKGIQGCGAEDVEINNVDVPAGTKLVYIETYIASSAIRDFLNYIVDTDSDWISILSTERVEGTLIPPGSVTIFSTIGYQTGNSDTVEYYVYDDRWNMLDYQEMPVSPGSGSIDFVSDISIGCINMVYIQVSFRNSGGIVDEASFPIKMPDVPILMVNPSSLSFVRGIGQNLPPQSISIDKCGPYDVSWYITDDADWLSEDPASGTTPSSVTVSVDSAGLQPGTYNGIITISSSQASNSPVTVPVTLDVYNIQVQWVTPPPNQMDSGVDYTVEYSISGEYSGCWRIQYGTDPDPINHPQSYTQLQCGGAGRYQDTLNVISCTGEPYYFVVAAWVNGYLFYSNIVSSGVNSPSGYLLRVEPSSLGFYAVAGGDNPPPQSLQINEVCGNSIDWNASVDADWLSVIPFLGNTPSSTDVSVDITGLSEGTYNGIITISSSQASNSPVTVPVTLNVIQVEWITPPPNPMDSGVDYTVEYSISGEYSGCSWIQYGTDPDPINHPQSYTQLQCGGAGRYQDTLNVISCTGEPYYFVVAAWVNGHLLYSNIVSSGVNPPSGYLLRVEPSSLGFYAVAGGDNPPPQSLQINEVCGNSIDWNASVDADWLSVIPFSGNTPSSTDVSVDITGLPRGTYEGIITISSSQASNSPVTVPVTLEVH